MSVVEVLIGLAIGALLLASVATAVHGSSRAMTTNEQFFKATQASRLSLLNMSTALRTAENAALGGAQPSLDQPSPIEWPDGGELKLAHLRVDKASGAQVLVHTNYKLVPADEPDQLSNLVLEYEDTGKQLVMARNVADLSFTGQLHKLSYVFCNTCKVQMELQLKDVETDPDLYVCPKDPTHTSGPTWELANVQIQMTVQHGVNAVTMSNSVVPRKVMIVR